jgi:hypothetical protein
MWVEYEAIMVERHGVEKVEEMKRRKHETVKYSKSDYKDIKDKYDKKYEDLLSEWR